MAVRLTKPKEIAVKPCDLTATYIHDQVFIAVEDDGSLISILGCRTLTDLAYYGALYGILQADHKPELRTLIHGVVLDAEDLPTEIVKEAEIFIFCDNWEFERVKTIEAATHYIEGMFRNISCISIDSFVIVAGKELSEGVKQSFSRLLLRESNKIEIEQENHYKQREAEYGAAIS